MTLYSLYVALDQATDGRFGRECSIRFTKFNARVAEFIKREREYDRSIGGVVWEAINIVEGDKRNTDGDKE